MSGTTVRWREWAGNGLQHLVLREEAGQIIAEAAVLGMAEDRPFAASFRIQCDRAWRVRRVEAGLVGDDRRIVLDADGSGRWRDGEGVPLPDLDGAIDVDLPITPWSTATAW